MPSDDAGLLEAREWLTKAGSDLRAASLDTAAEPPLLEDAVFHCQQACEKALKAYLAWHNQPFRKTHDLVELGALCARRDPSLEPLLRQAAPLTEYAWLYRYPGVPRELTTSEVVGALNIASTVFEAISNRLPQDARPC